MGCMNIVIFLIQNQASPDEATVRGETPLHLAARANQTDIIRILLRNGAKVDARAAADCGSPSAPGGAETTICVTLARASSGSGAEPSNTRPR